MSSEILYEMNLSSLTPKRIIKNRLRVDRKTNILLIPDSNTNVYSNIENLGLFLTNCNGIVSPNSMISFGPRKINARHSFYDLKKHLQSSEYSGRKLQVMPTHPIEKDQRASTHSANYFFQDGTFLMKGYQNLLKRTSPKMATLQLFNKLSELYDINKRKDPNMRHEVIFLIKNQNGTLLDMIENLRRYIPIKTLEELNFADNYCFAANGDQLIVPILYKEKMKNKLIIQNVNKLESLFYAEEEVKSIKKQEIAIDEPENDNQVGNSIISRMVQNLQKKNLSANVDEDGNVQVGINTRQLTNVLKKFKINDPDIVANVKSALENYVSMKGGKLTRDEAEIAVLKAINYTVHGKEELDEEYINKPQLLIKKLANISTHKTPLVFPKNNISVIDPDSIVDIKHTTGVWRQKQEFEQTIHTNIRKLFESLQTISNKPIKIKKVEHEIVDSDMDRYILYKVTVQNTGGGDSKPYTVELKVPGLINDRYFKIGGSTYIMALQQFLKPVTKTDKNEVRVLSNYAIVRVGLQNLKFNPADIDEILEYIRVRYSTLITTQDETSCSFRDGSVIYFAGNKVYTSSDVSVTLDPESSRLIDNTGVEIKIGRSEYLYERLIDKIHTINPDDKLTKTKKSIPYITFYIGGVKIPLIIYLWQLKGLLTSLNDLGIDYEITKEPDPALITVNMRDGNYLQVNPENTREQLIVNGLLASRIKGPFTDLNDPEEIHPLIDSVYGSKATLNMRLVTQNDIDPITHEMLEFENLPTNLPKLVSEHCVDTLLNQKVDSLADLKIYRARLSEIMLNSMYKQLMMAHNNYTKKVDMLHDDNAQLALDPDYIMRDMVTDAGVLQHTEPVNPIDEIFLASRTIKTGTGGTPNKRAFKPEHRNIHPSHYGIMSANTTPESNNVGLIVAHTLTPVIVNEYGSYGHKDLQNISPWGALSASEILIPFQNEMDSDRLVMAVTHAKQVTPTDGNEPPLVATGGEFIIPQISSTRFVQRAKMDGTVTEVVPNKTMTVEYRNGKQEVFDIIPRMSRTKMGCYMNLDMQTLKEGTKVKKNQIIAHTKNFSDNGLYSSGKNVFLAVMQYNGMGHEDAYVITNDMSQDMSRDIVKEVSIVLPPDAKLINLEKEFGKKVYRDDVLVEFAYQADLDEYLELNQLEQLGEEEILSSYAQGQDSIKLMAVDGEIVDIKVYVNNKNSVDKQIVNFHKQLATDTKTQIKKLTSHIEVPEEKIKATDNISLSFLKFGGHKLKGGVEFLGARIVYYIKQKLPLTDGDKVANRYGAKGVNIMRTYIVIYKIKSREFRGTRSINLPAILSQASI